MLNASFKINKTSSIPIAEQISRYISAQILSGELNAGEKLPAERDLAHSLGISRGTVKRAYEKLLLTGAIEMRKGSGSYILESNPLLETNNKQEAAEIISTTLDQLLSIGFSKKELLNLVNLHLSAYENIRKLSIMVVSNNYEILSALETQLAYLSSTSLFSFALTYLTLDTVQKNTEPIELLFNYDLIIATSIDYSEIVKIAPCYGHKIIEATITPCTETLISLSNLQRNKQLRIIYRAPVFMNLVVDTLLNMGFDKKNILTTSEYDYHPTAHSDDEVNVLINFNESPVYTDLSFEKRNTEFTQNGGLIFHFEYRIDRNALTYIEDRIQSLLSDETLS